MRSTLIATVALVVASSPAVAQQSLRASEAELARSIDALGTLVHEPLARWRSTGGGNCDHQALTDARLTAVNLPTRLDPKKVGIPALMRAGGWAVDVGDAAREGGCLAIARQMYEHVMRVYIGTSYQGVRDRARVGLDALR